MSLVAVETDFGALTTAVYPGGYDPAKLNLGPTMGQFSESGNEGKFVGPVPVAFTRPMESAAVLGGHIPYAISWSTNIDWIFMPEATAAGASPRKIMMWMFNRTTHAFTLQGVISLAFPSAATNYTHIALRATYDKYSVGTAACAGGTTTVTGASTPNWQTARLAAGSRIAFGTTDPTTNPTWYEISSIGSDTGIVLTTNGPNTGGQGVYVIEELRLVLVTTNNTTTSGGVYIAKGLRPEIFTSGITAIAAASGTDNLRAVYWLADAATVTNITSKGASLEARADWQTHYLWVFEGLASPNEVLFKYNVRALLTLTTGKNVTPFESFVFKTGAGGAFTGAPSAINNMRLATMASGPGSGANCLYFTTASRIYRTLAVGSISTGSTTWLSGGDVMTEVPPGGTAIGFAVTGALNSIEYIDAIDKLLILTTNATATKAYITGYNAVGSQMDRIFMDDFRQTLQVSSDAIGLAPLFNTQSTSGIAAFEIGGLCYIAVPGTTATTNFVYSLPLGADWEYTSVSNSVVITPSMATPNCASLYRVVCNEVAVIGGRTGQNLGATTEPYRISYRTTGISDNTGSWNLLDYTGDLTGVGAVTAIQFKLEFRTIGHTNLPARITNIICLYNDTATDTHFQASVALSSPAATVFAWRFSTLFGGTPPTLYVRLFDATNPSTLYLTDNSATPTGGVWMYSTNSGGGWSAFPVADKGNETTYIKYTPTSFGSGIKVRAVLSLS